MKRTLACLLVIVLVCSLPARENPLAMGFQVGLAATGAVLDVDLGPLSLNAGFNYPVLYTYMAATSNIDPQDVFLKVATFTLDISKAFPLGRGFDFKLGLGSIVLTDFGPLFGGLAGVVLKRGVLGSREKKWHIPQRQLTTHYLWGIARLYRGWDLI